MRNREAFEAETKRIKSGADFTMRSDRMKAAARIRDLENALAAKDVILLKCRSYVLHRPDPSDVLERFTLIRDIDAVLPARETE